MAGTQDKQENIPKRPNIRQKTYLKGQTEYKNIPKRPNRLQKTSLKCQKKTENIPKKPNGEEIRSWKTNREEITWKSDYLVGASVLLDSF